MKTRGTFILGLVLLVAVLLCSAMLSGCGSSSSETSTTATEPGTDTTVASTETTGEPVTFDGSITIGGLCTLTGPGAMTGAEQKWAEEKAVADINAKGGVNVGGKKMELKLTLVDDKSDANEAAAAMEKLIKVEGLKLILGTQVTPLNLAAATVAEKYQAYLQMTTTYTDVVRANNYKWCTDLFCTPASSGDVPFLIVEAQPQADRPTKWGLLTEDNADGQTVAGGVTAMAEGHKANLVVTEAISPGAKDFASSILKFKQAEVDALVCFVSPADGITFTKQMKEQAFSPKFMVGWKGFWPTEFMKGLGPDSDYICHDGFWFEGLPYPGAKELGQAYDDAHGGSDSVSIGLYYASVQIMAAAIERAGSTDPAAVRDQVFNGTFEDTTMGDVTYDAQGVSDIQPLGLQWLNQKRVVIYPEELATGKLEWFVPWDKR